MIPKRLKKGDTIGIVSPSAPVSQDLKDQFEEGQNFLKNLGFNIKLGEDVFENNNGSLVTPEEKANDINSMFADEDVAAIICSQGGETANSVLPLLDFDIIKSNPKILLGISDITVLLNAIYYKTGLVTFHGNDILWGFGKNPTTYDKQEFKRRLIKNNPEIKFNSEWVCVREGVAEGELIGGNLSCLNKLAGTEYFPNFGGKVLFLESFGGSSSPDEVEGELYHLKQLGVFEKIKGLWLGHYSHESEITYEEIMARVVKGYSFPVLACDDFGHNTPNTIIPIGARAELDAKNGKICLLDAVVL